MNIPQERRLVLFAGLAALMALTRFGHVGSGVLLPDASWAVFFLAGFYLAPQRNWAFPALMLEAVLVDLIAIRYLGVSNYCVTLAYWFIVPAYAVLWLGGAWLRARFSFSLHGLYLLAASLLLTVSLCYLVTNGSFYWLGLSSRELHPDFAGWMQNLGDWYFRFLVIPCGYVAAAAAAHVLALQLRGRSPKGALGGSR